MPHHDGHPCPSAAYVCARQSATGTAHPTTWGTLRRALSTHRRPRAADKGSAPCWAPHTLGPSGRRRADNVVSISALVLDYDDGTDVVAAMDLFDRAERAAHTTYSSTPDAPRLRLILPLLEPVAGDIWADVYRLLLRDLDRPDQAADPKCVDPSRLFLLPCQGPDMRADYAEGDLLDLSPYVERAHLDRHHAALAASARRDRQAQIARAAATWAATGQAEDRAARRAAAILATQPEARQAAAEAVGAKVVSRAGARIAIRARCPACGRPDVWWAVDAQRAAWARCNHVSSCGWSGPLTALLDASGVPVHSALGGLL